MTSATVAGLIALGLALPAAPLLAQPRETLSIDASAPAQPFAHFWEHMFGSGRAVLSLRESYREDLRAVREATAVSYVRFHALLHDEMGVYTVDKKGAPVFNFSYVDQAYDGLLANGVRPIVQNFSVTVSPGAREQPAASTATDSIARHRIRACPRNSRRREPA